MAQASDGGRSPSRRYTFATSASQIARGSTGGGNDGRAAALPGARVGPARCAVISSAAMPSEPARALDPEFPNLRPEVIAAYRDPPPGTVVEVIGGELYAMPRPRPRHQNTAGELYGELRGPFRRGVGGPGGWVFLPEPEPRLGDRPDLVEPDLAGWHRERLPELPEDAAIRVTPDWVCEVLSATTRRHDTAVKMPMYYRHGVGHAWLVDPEARTLQVFRRVTDGWLLVLSEVDDAVVRAEPFAAVELPLATLWSW